MHDDTQVIRVGEVDCRRADVVDVHDEVYEPLMEHSVRPDTTDWHDRMEQVDHTCSAVGLVPATSDE